MKLKSKQSLIFLAVVSLLLSAGYLIYNLQQHLPQLQTVRQNWQQSLNSKRSQNLNQPDTGESEQGSGSDESTSVSEGENQAADQPEPQLEPDQEAETSQEEISQQSTYIYQAESAGQTPFSLLNQNETVEYTQYEMGVFINSINGLAASEDSYWALYVNGEYAQQAADQIELKAGDEVKWVYQSMDQFPLSEE